MSRSIRFLGVMGFVLMILAFGVVDRENSGSLARSNRPVGFRSTNGYDLTVEQSTPNQIKLSCKIHSVEFTDSPRSKTPGTAVIIDGMSTLMAPGTPAVPVLRVPVALPVCDGVTIEYRVRKFRLKRNISLAINENRRGIHNELNYPSAPSGVRPLPDQVVTLERISKVRDQRVGVITIYPVGYDAASKEATIREDVEIKVNLLNSSGPTSVDVGPFENVVAAGLVNRKSYGRPMGSSGLGGGPLMTGGVGSVTWCSGADWRAVADCAISAGTDYLIVLAQGLDETLTDNLATRRAEFNGFNVSVARMRNIDPTPNDTTTADTLRAFIKKVYDSKSAVHMSDSLLAYVLLLGDAAGPNGEVLLPPYYGFRKTDDYGRSCSDAYYSFLSDDDPHNDFFADLFIGRIPADSISNASPPDSAWELRNIVNKILDYNPGALDTKRTLLVAGGQELHLGNFKEVFDFVDDHYIPPFFDGAETVVHKMYRNDWWNNIGVNDTIDKWFGDSVATRLVDDEYWLLGLYDHGSAYYLKDAFYPMHYDISLNDSIPFLALILASYMGWFDIEIDNPIPFCGLDTANTGYGCYTPTVNMDSYDAAAERLLLQENGAIGVISYARSQGANYDAGSNFAYYFRSIFENNAFTLGEILLSTRWYLFPDAQDWRAERELTLFGDPALNIVWEGLGGVESDTTDLAAHSNEIQFVDAIKNRYLDVGAETDVRVKVHNKWKNDAVEVVVGVWDGDPAKQGASLLNSDTLAVVPAYGSTTTDITISGLTAGKHEIYVQIDTTSCCERTYANNRAYSILRVHDYQAGFPFELSAQGAHSVTIADVSSTSPGEELIISTSEGLKCFDAAGDLVWARNAQHYGDYAGFNNGTPLVAPIYKSDKLYCLQLDSLLYVLDASNGGVPVDTILLEDRTVVPVQNNHTRILAVADLIPDDDTLEIIVAGRRITGEDSDGLYLQCYRVTEGYGEKVWESRLTDEDELVAECDIAVGDLDGDGAPEVVSRTTLMLNAPDSVYVFDASGDPKWVVPVGNSYQYWHNGIALVKSAQFADSVTMDVLTLGVEGAQEELFMHRIDNTGDVTKYSLGTFRAFPWIAVVDYDDDGEVETIVCNDKETDYSISDGELRIVETDGTIVSDFVVSRASMASPLVVDTDLTAGVEIVTVTRDEPEFNTVLGGEYVIKVFDSSLDMIREYSFPFNAETDGQKYGGSNSRYVMPFVLPAVSDIDADGVAELAFVSWDSVFHVVEIGATTGPDQWPQRYKTAAQSNNFGQPLAGEYESDMTIFEDVNVVGDVRVSGTLDVVPGTRIKVQNEDALESGVDSLLCELYIDGELNAIGSATKPVKITAWDGLQESVAPDDWWGIWISQGASATFRNCQIRNAVQGIRTRASITVDSCTIELCDEIGLSIAMADSVFVRRTTIRDSDIAGINLLQNGVATISDCTIENMAAYGVDVYSGAKLYADGTVVRDCEWGIRVFIGDSLTASAEIDSCFLIGNDEYGLKGYATSDVTLTNCVIDSNEVNGVFCDSSASISIEDNSIEHNAVGIYCYDNSGPSITQNSIKNNSTGIMCDDEANAVIEENVITNNGTGVAAINDADPDLGHSSGGLSSGDNSIHNNSGFHVGNFTSGLTIKAENNYWKGKTSIFCQWEPKASKIYGLVDFCPALEDAPQQAPQSEMIITKAEELPKVYALGQNYPNPFNPATTIKYQVPPPGGNVRVVIYNVRGQRVATLVDSHELPGFHSVTWDGSNARGHQIASGVYFIQMEAPGFMKTRKLLLLK